jgi:hypothetical protein
MEGHDWWMDNGSRQEPGMLGLILCRGAIMSDSLICKARDPRQTRTAKSLVPPPRTSASNQPTTQKIFRGLRSNNRFAGHLISTTLLPSLHRPIQTIHPPTLFSPSIPSPSSSTSRYYPGDRLKGPGRRLFPSLDGIRGQKLQSRGDSEP